MPATTPTTRPKRRWLRWLIALLLALLVWLLAVAAAIWSYASRSDAQPSDAIVVLGASAPQGVPSPVFAARIDHAITLQQHGVALTRHFYARMFQHNPELREIFNQGHQRSGTQQQALAMAVAAYAEHIDDPRC